MWFIAKFDQLSLKTHKLRFNYVFFKYCRINNVNQSFIGTNMELFRFHSLKQSKQFID